MASLEQSIKSQFAKVFGSSDAPLFKKIAEANLCEATALRKNDMMVENSLKLLARNARKRLLIGIGVELLLKAVYLKQDFCINKPTAGTPLKFPFLSKSVKPQQLQKDQTFMLNDLLQHLPKVVSLSNKTLTCKGLNIAKVFRNKEGHVVTTTHAFDASNYTDIAVSLEHLYKDAFQEHLSVRFSVKPNEPAVWKISPFPRSS